jgi:hypothetical protein
MEFIVNNDNNVWVLCSEVKAGKTSCLHLQTARGTDLVSNKTGTERVSSFPGLSSQVVKLIHSHPSTPKTEWVKFYRFSPTSPWRNTYAQGQKATRRLIIHNLKTYLITLHTTLIIPKIRNLSHVRLGEKLLTFLYSGSKSSVIRSA